MNADELRNEVMNAGEKTGVLILDHFDSFLRQHGYDGRYVPLVPREPPQLEYKGITDKNRLLTIRFEWYVGKLSIGISRAHTSRFLTDLLHPSADHFSVSGSAGLFEDGYLLNNNFVGNNHEEIAKEHKRFFERYLLDLIDGKSWLK